MPLAPQSIHLAWNHPDAGKPGVRFYVYEKCSVNGQYTFVAQTVETNLTLPAELGAHFFTVLAVNDCGVSAQSNP